MIFSIPETILQINTNENGNKIYVERTDTGNKSLYKDLYPTWRIVAPTYAGVEVDKSNFNQLKATMDPESQLQFQQEYLAWKEKAEAASLDLYGIYMSNCCNTSGQGAQIMCTQADKMHYDALTRW